MSEEVATGAGLQREAEVALSDLFGLGKKDVDSLEVLGFLLYEQGRIQEAEAVFRGLIALDSRRHTGYAGLGALALAAQNISGAVTWLKDATQRNPDDPAVHANLGEALLKQGSFEDAAAEFERALALDPEQKDPGANRARAILAGMQVVVDELRRNLSAAPQTGQNG